MTPNLTVDYPVPVNATWAIHDSTKLQEYMDCPRRYFYSYVLGWRPDRPSNHLIFGGAFHVLMEHLLRCGRGNESLLEAYKLALEHYRRTFSPETDSLFKPKDPDTLLKAAIAYVSTYAADHFEVLYTEVAGTVPVSESDVMHFRIDAILQDERGIYVQEHKTGSQNSRQWEMQWLLKVQAGTYSHVLHSIWNPADVWGVEINGVFFQKSGIQFKRVPIRKAPDMMQVWLTMVQHYLNDIDSQFEMLSYARESDDVLAAFPLNTESCTKYFGCPFHDFCGAWANPLRRSHEPPLGFHVEHWNPESIERPARTLVENGRIVAKERQA